ncbi:MAG: 23S rRNA (adenine(2503)-C(2))-methyltransferase RlmN [Planctomycetes bacterium]|nr:23S rRNA (adenine(2503)-C(2))-methyltransferase RlmN [Planctomycetota bacterium]
MAGKDEMRLHVPGMMLDEIEDACVAMGARAFRGRQMVDWLYGKLAAGLDEMLNLSKDFRARAAGRFDLYRSQVEETLTASDKTTKLLLKLLDGKRIETVLIPAPERLTCCISTQVGCAMGCILCASGLCGFERNLAAGEIVEQVLHAARAAGSRITHIVVMGIGEPLANYKEVLMAIKILNAPWAFNIAARRITVSTVGIPAAIERLAGEGLQINLAISLHASNDLMRNQIVPVNRKFGMDKILHAARHYFAKTGREITFEYALIAGMNDGVAAAEELARRLKNYPCTVNLIPFNPVPELGLEPATEQGVDEFMAVLRRRGVNVTVRKARGVDIHAACGQLRARNV